MESRLRYHHLAIDNGVEAHRYHESRCQIFRHCATLPAIHIYPTSATDADASWLLQIIFFSFLFFTPLSHSCFFLERCKQTHITLGSSRIRGEQEEWKWKAQLAYEKGFVFRRGAEKYIHHPFRIFSCSTRSFVPTSFQGQSRLGWISWAPPSSHGVTHLFTF